MNHPGTRLAPPYACASGDGRFAMGLMTNLCAYGRVLCGTRTRSPT
jgi:hypothetical protein